jgi:hypothetical protein
MLRCCGCNHACLTRTFGHRDFCFDFGFFFQAGSPAELLADPKSLFSALVKNDKGAAAQVGTPKPSSENLAALA